jgi:hypothetical protein
VLFPFLGLALEIGLSSKTIRIISIAAVVILIPILFGYNYTLSDAYRFLVLILLACLYSFFSRQIQKNTMKFVAAVLSAGLLLVILGYAYFIAIMAGSQTTEKKWKLNGYQIEYIKDQGYTGHLMKYELSKFTMIPILMKKIETVVEDDSINNCTIRFDKSKIIFNKCNGTLQKCR